MPKRKHNHVEADHSLFHRCETKKGEHLPPSPEWNARALGVNGKFFTFTPNFAHCERNYRVYSYQANY